jgi:hypothetical protein
MFFGRRQKVRSQKVLAAQKQAYDNSLKNLRLARIIFFMALGHLIYTLLK